MIQEALNGMLALLLAKFMLNDVPHAMGLTSWKKSASTENLEKTAVPSTPTDFYHVTPASMLSTIMAKGLKPPAGPKELVFAPWIMKKGLGRKKFFPAIYLWGDDSDAYQFAEFLYVQGITKEPLAILRVDLAPGNVVYVDPDTPFIMVSSWMFFEAIPPERISLIEVVEKGKVP